jgi:putative nucleotidyltransferase with HDIG domain
MSGFKPLLKVNGQNLIERVIGVFREAGVDEILVVTGHRAAEVQAVCDKERVTTVHNPDYRQDMFSSVASGAEKIPAGCDAFFVLPVDAALVRPATLKRLIQSYSLQPGRIFHPVFSGQRGHPPLIPTVLAEQITNSRVQGGLRVFLSGHEDISVDVEVADRHILFDVNTPEDEIELLTRWEQYGIPTGEECRIILEKIHPMNQAVMAHSHMVARIAGILGRALSDAGLSLDGNLIRAGALLHDVAKGRKDHATVGADWLCELGFDAVAGIVAAHMDIDPDSTAEPDEAAVVYLADKYVEGDRVTSLDLRFGKTMDLFKDDPLVVSVIRRRKDQAEALRQKIEARLGYDIETLFP